MRYWKEENCLNSVSCVDRRQWRSRRKSMRLSTGLKQPLLSRKQILESKYDFFLLLVMTFEMLNSWST